MDAQFRLERWENLCRSLGIISAAAIEKEFERLTMAYGEPHRAYHTSQHIHECLTLLDELLEKCKPPDLLSLEMALWYHDLVHLPQSSKNESESMAQAAIFLRDNDVSTPSIKTITRLIMATRHFSDFGATTGLEKWMVDIDLGILGAPTKRFLQYEQQIREEYSWLSPDVYNSERRRVLITFLERPRLYHSTLFFERFEKQAQKNLLCLLSQPNLLP
ncbi:MAG: hypothetical protein AAF821_04235 [Cyanobacteria bacterium P01_D01_bin.156]